MYYLGYSLQLLAFLYTLVLLARLALSYIEFFVPQWNPRGPFLVIANLVWALTEPPLRWLRARIKPLNLGAVSLDVGFMILFIAVLMVGKFATYLM
ncbi:MAG: YggT family protein [Actinomycetaceae bacterium]|nr:YggT family protein [Actinomycetaceae bacterium]